ncbi:hypothetical protein C0991_008275, partial [Blastosporella zonata]
ESSESNMSKLNRIRSERGLSGRKAVNHMHNTLFIALVASPLLLLLPCQFGEIAGRQKLFDEKNVQIVMTEPKRGPLLLGSLGLL